MENYKDKISVLEKTIANYKKDYENEKDEKKSDVLFDKIYSLEIELADLKSQLESLERRNRALDKLREMSTEEIFRMIVSFHSCEGAACYNIMDY